METLFLIKYKIFRKNLTQEIGEHNHNIYTGKIPICYRYEYNLFACGLEKLHPFDSTKYMNSNLIFIDISNFINN